MTSWKEVDTVPLRPARLASLACQLAFLCLATAATAETRTFSLVVPTVAPVEPRVFRVNENDAVRVRVTSAVPGEVHLHAYRLHARVAAGVPAELNFTARATGRFRIEWHGVAGAGTTGDHHAPPLATLEVWPR